MISDLFINACILITTIFITIELLQNDNIKRMSQVKKSILSGILFSISSMLLMKYNIFVTEESFLDFRNVSQSASAFYGGAISSLITGLFSALFRIFYFGLDKNSLLTFINMAISSILCAYIARSMWSRKIKWSLMIIITKFMHILLFALVIPNSDDLLGVIVFLWMGTAVVATIVYFVIDHLSIAHREIERLKEQATIDYLTGVHNTRNFNFLYNKYLRVFKEKNEVFSVLMLDIDFFKNTNDTFGHLAGDLVLKELGQIFKKLSEKEDVLVGRVGGEEFCILLRGFNRQEAVEFAENLRLHIAENEFVLHSEQQIHVTVSIGVGTYKDTVSDIRDVREFADYKLYESKKTGRNRVCY